MVSLKVYDRSGNEVGSLDVDLAAIAPAVNKQLLHDVVVMYQANRRQGSHRTKSRAEVAGTTKKMYRQKGTGNARAGHRRRCLCRGRPLPSKLVWRSTPRDLLNINGLRALMNEIRAPSGILMS